MTPRRCPYCRVDVVPLDEPDFVALEQAALDRVDLAPHYARPTKRKSVERKMTKMSTMQRLHALKAWLDDGAKTPCDPAHAEALAEAIDCLESLRDAEEQLDEASCYRDTYKAERRVEEALRFIERMFDDETAELGPQ